MRLVERGPRLRLPSCHCASEDWRLEVDGGWIPGFSLARGLRHATPDGGGSPPKGITSSYKYLRGKMVAGAELRSPGYPFFRRGAPPRIQQRKGNEMHRAVTIDLCLVPPVTVFGGPRTHDVPSNAVLLSAFRSVETVGGRSGFQLGDCAQSSRLFEIATLRGRCRATPYEPRLTSSEGWVGSL
ncbi:hypothetical protein VUR80DRAFT_5046 [Thermomyces stellatus]